MRRLCKCCFGEIDTEGFSVHGGQDVASRIRESTEKIKASAFQPIGKDASMSINFSDPNQTQHDGKPNPIRNKETFDAGLEVMQKLYAFFRVPWGDEALKAYEADVSKGLTLRAILERALDDYGLRLENLPSAANPPVPFPPQPDQPKEQRKASPKQVNPDGEEEHADNGKDKGKHVRTESHTDAPAHRPADRPGRPGAAQRE